MLNAFGSEARRRMRERGVSERALARQVGYDPGFLNKVLNGKKPLGAKLAALIDKALGANGELAALAETPAGTVAPTGATATLSAGLPQMAWLAARWRAGPELVQQLRERNARLRRLDDYLGGADTYLTYMNELQATMTLLRNITATELVRRDLLAVVAEQAQQAGWAAFDAGWLPDARRLFETSVQAARDAGDAALAANGVCYIAYQETNTGRGGAGTAEAACGMAGRNAAPTLRVLLLGRLAWAHALVGHPDATDRALAMAEEALSRDDGSGPDWTYWVNRAEVEIMAGRCWTALHRPLRAVPILEDTLATYDGTHAREKALYSTWLAEAYLDAREPEQAAMIAGQALEAASGVASARPRERAAMLMRRLEPYRRLPAVASVLDRAARDAIPLPSGPPIPGTEPTQP